MTVCGSCVQTSKTLEHFLPSSATQTRFFNEFPLSLSSDSCDPFFGLKTEAACVKKESAAVYYLNASNHPVQIQPGTAVFTNQTFGVHIRVSSVRMPCGTKGCGRVVLTHQGQAISTIDLYDNLWYFEGEIRDSQGSSTGAHPYV